MKMKLFVAFIFVAFMGLSSVAMAQDTDIAKLPCKDYTAASKPDMTNMLMWVDGYLSGKSDNTVINEEWMTKLAMHLVKFCTANSGKTLMDAIDALPEE